MSTLVISYDALSRIANHASNLAKEADYYANNLTSKVVNKFGSISGGASNYTSDAQYYVNAKVQALNSKNDSYESLSRQITNFLNNARRVDESVERMIANSQERFLQKHEKLRINEWKAKILNWLVDLKNSCPLYELIGNALENMDAALSDMFANIKYWYKCEGGKEIIGFVLAIGGAIVAVLLFVACFPASGFVAICAAIGAGIALVNAFANIFTSYSAMKAAKNGDPAWAQIYGKRDKVSDIFRETNYNSGLLNRISYGAATMIDGVELFCDVVNIGGAIGKMKSKFGFIQNYFDKNIGLLSYCKQVKWTEVMDYDNLGNLCGNKWTMAVKGLGVVETKFTPNSIWRGVKAYVMDSPIDCKTDAGIRTLLNKNFVIDFKDFKNSFNISAFKETFGYIATDGNRISFSEWKSTFNFTAFKDTLKYNLKYNCFTGMIQEDVEWKNKKDFIKSAGNTIRSVTNTTTKIETVLTEKYDVNKEIKDKLWNFSDITKAIKKIKDAGKHGATWITNTYTLKDAYGTH